MKLLFIIPSITNYFTFLEDLIEELIDSGNEVMLATSTQHISEIECYQRGLRCTLHDIAFPRGFSFRAHLKAARALNQLVQQSQPDLINIHFSAAIFTAALAKKSNWPICVATFHGLSFPIITGWQKIILGMAERWAASRMDVCYVLTEDDRETLSRSMIDVRTFRSYGLGCNLSGFDKSKIDTGAALALKNEFNIKPSDFVLIFIGRQVHFKGFDKIVRAFISLYSEHNNFKLILVGAPDNIHSNNLSAEEEREMKDCRGIISVGWKENVNEYLNISDVNVFPSNREGMPVNLMESLAMGVPVVTVNTRGCRDIVIHEIDGIVLEENTVDALKSAILNLYHHRENLERYSRNALRARFRFDRKNFIKEQFGIFEELTGLPAGISRGDKVHSEVWS